MAKATTAYVPTAEFLAMPIVAREPSRGLDFPTVEACLEWLDARHGAALDGATILRRIDPRCYRAEWAVDVDEAGLTTRRLSGSGLMMTWDESGRLWPWATEGRDDG